jgi:hypothetical protein
MSPRVTVGLAWRSCEKVLEEKKGPDIYCRAGLTPVNGEVLELSGVLAQHVFACPQKDGRTSATEKPVFSSCQLGLLRLIGGDGSRTVDADVRCEDP